MSQIHESRRSVHPFIDRIWKTQNVTDGTYLATPDGAWDLIMGIDRNGKANMMIAGQATRPVYVPYRGGTSSIVISFAAGVYIPQLPGEKLLDKVEVLANADDDHFVLFGHSLPFPTFDTVEQLVEEMVRLGLLKDNEVVSSVLQGSPKAKSKRAVQRHFVRTTGTTSKQLQQISRAQQAVKLLKQGEKPADAAAEAGYTDQSHLSRSLKKIMDSAPSDVDDIHKL